MKYRPRIMLAPDDGAATVAIPADSSPTGQQIDVTPRQAPPPPEIIQQQPDKESTPKVRQSGVKTSARDVVKELGLAEAPSESVKKLAAQLREKGTGRFAPKETAEEQAKEPPAKKEQAKPAAKQPEKQPPAAEKPPEKVKIGDKEYTPQELADIIAKNTQPTEEKKPEGSKQEAPAEEQQKEQAGDEQTPEQIEERRKMESDWITKRVSSLKLEDYGINITEDALDNILSGGKKAVAAFQETLLRVAVAAELNARKWSSARIAEERQTLQSTLNPIVTERAEIAKSVEEYRFIEANPEIKAAGKPGIIAMREAAAALHEEYDAMQIAVAKNPNNTFAKTRLEKLEKNWLAEVASATKDRIKTATTATQPAAATPPAKMPAKRPPAPTGQTGGGSGGVMQTKSDARSQIEELKRFGG